MKGVHKMEWTEEELRVLSADEAADAINSLLQKSLVYNGAVKIQMMGPTRLDFMIHAFRKYRAMLGG